MHKDLDAVNTDKVNLGEKKETVNIQSVKSAGSSDSTFTFERQKEEAFGT